MTQELSIPLPNSESRPGSESSTVISVSIADPYVLLRMTDGSILLLAGDLTTCTVSINTPTAFEGSKKMVSACTLYHDKCPEPWLCKASTDAWLSTGIGESIDGADGGPHDQGDIYCVICYESGALEILDVPNSIVFSLWKNLHLEEPTLSMPIHWNLLRILRKEQLRVHPQLCDGSIVASTVLHNVSCNHGFINVTSQIPLRGTPHQVTYFADRNLYPIIVSVPMDNHNLSADELHRTYTVDEFKNTATKDNESLLAIEIAYIQGDDVAPRGCVILFSVGRNTDIPQNLVYSKELKGAISALASLQGRLLIASGPKIILHNWSGSELNGIAFFDAPPLYVVKNFILLGDVHNSIYFLSWNELGAQLSLLAEDLAPLIVLQQNL
ncbi:hypothetical protein POUND7_007093 [Theobroma cacao]